MSKEVDSVVITEQTKPRSVVLGEFRLGLARGKQATEWRVTHRTGNVVSILPQTCRTGVFQLFERVAVVMNVELWHGSASVRGTLNVSL